MGICIGWAVALGGVIAVGMYGVRVYHDETPVGPLSMPGPPRIRTLSVLPVLPTVSTAGAHPRPLPGACKLWFELVMLCSWIMNRQRLIGRAAFASYV